MDFSSLTDTPEQAELRSVIRDFLAANRTGEVWKRLSGELGLTALAVPEDHGGMGATFAEVAVAIEETGRVLLPVPYLPTAVGATILAEAASASEAAERFLPGLADGALTGALALGPGVTLSGGRASGAVPHVLEGAAAGVFLVRAGDALVAVRAADAEVTPLDTLDQTRGQATVSFAGAPALRVSPDGDDGGVFADRAEDLLRTALAAESAAAAGRCLEITVEYLKTRVQFGRPIGEFQALKHRCADLAVETTSAHMTAHAAVRAAISDPAEFAVAAPLAKRYCADVFAHAAAEMIQLHGGIGFTWEHDAHRYLKRAKSTQLLHGTPSQLRTLLAHRARLLPEGPDE